MLGLLIGLAWLLKRYGPKPGGGLANLRVVGALNLGGRERIMVVEVGDQWIVVGAAPGRVNALAHDAAPGRRPGRGHGRRARQHAGHALRRLAQEHDGQTQCVINTLVAGRWPGPAAADRGGPARHPGIPSSPAANGGTAYSLPVQTLLLLTSLTFLPAALLMMTSFTRIIIVLSLLRQALGTQTAPPNQVMVGLALFLTLFVMGPTFDKIYSEAYLPLQNNQIQMTEAMNRGAVPLKEFMIKQTRESDLALFVKISRSPALQGPEDIPLRVLIPGLRHQRTEDRIPDRLCDLHPVPDHRHGGRLGPDVDGHDDDVAGRHRRCRSS